MTAGLNRGARGAVNSTQLGSGTGYSTGAGHSTWRRAGTSRNLSDRGQMLCFSVYQPYTRAGRDAGQQDVRILQAVFGHQRVKRGGILR
jgi:hypothetical protein